MPLNLSLFARPRGHRRGGIGPADIALAITARNDPVVAAPGLARVVDVAIGRPVASATVLTRLLLVRGGGGQCGRALAAALRFRRRIARASVLKGPTSTAGVDGRKHCAR